MNKILSGQNLVTWWVGSGFESGFFPGGLNPDLDPFFSLESDQNPDQPGPTTPIHTSAAFHEVRA